MGHYDDVIITGANQSTATAMAFSERRQHLHVALTVAATSWLPRKKLTGSYFAFTAMSRSMFSRYG